MNFGLDSKKDVSLPVLLNEDSQKKWKVSTCSNHSHGNSGDDGINKRRKASVEFASAPGENLIKQSKKTKAPVHESGSKSNSKSEGKA